ncbi:AEC family transporter [Streptomyces bambusae]|uniref:AEC family transporter n=1 Tax=Streptomyces bambusae TaxID=1550616 RepID=UPI001D000026|nr:AEC family transporter [Streptomyces bambusae]MCB5169825.1 AEC family transporter [Streptomyces bambusae]
MTSGVLAGFLAFLPIWAITGLGWAAGRYDVLGPQAQSVLGRFAFSFAMPALLFLTLSRSRPADLVRPGVLVFALSLVAVFAVAQVIGLRVFRRGQGDRAIASMAAAHVNSANLGIPVAIHVLKDTSFVVTVALFQTLLVTPLILVLIDLDVRRGARDRVRRLLSLPLRNPIVAASAAGLAVAALGRPLPAAVTDPLTMLSGAAVPAALFALGMSLHTRTRPDAGGRAERRVLVALKLAAQPAFAYAVGRWLFGLDGHALLSVVLVAGLPTAQNAFLFASEYRLDADLARDTVLMSTIGSMVSLSVITWLLAA